MNATAEPKESPSSELEAAPVCELEAAPARSKGPKMQPVTSSNVSAVGYTPGPGGKPGNLYVDFKSGDRYVYGDVPAEEFEGLLASESPGRYLTRRIKGVYGHHKAEREL